MPARAARFANPTTLDSGRTIAVDSAMQDLLVGLCPLDSTNQSGLETATRL
jgi:hypothetical protein